jgi:hypothetical protein
VDASLESGYWKLVNQIPFSITQSSIHIPCTIFHYRQDDEEDVRLCPTFVETTVDKQGFGRQAGIEGQ